MSEFRNKMNVNEDFFHRPACCLAEAGRMQTILIFALLQQGACCAVAMVTTYVAPSLFLLLLFLESILLARSQKHVALSYSRRKEYT